MNLADLMVIFQIEDVKKVIVDAIFVVRTTILRVIADTITPLNAIVVTDWVIKVNIANRILTKKGVSFPMYLL